MQNKNKHESGQVFLIAVLILVIGLTVGLSVASRSVTNLKSSLEEENSQRAFAAAEAGVEKALKGVKANDISFGEANTKIKTVSIDEIKGTKVFLNNGAPIEANDGMDVWLSSDNKNILATTQNNTLTFYWTGRNACDNPPPPALEVIVFAKSSTAPNPVASQRYVYDPCRRVTATPDTNSSSGYSIQESNGALRTQSFQFKTDPIVVVDGYIARAIPLYSSSPIAVEATTALPLQGNVINSTGTSGGTTRKITYFQGWPKIPNEIFQYVLFQPN